MKNRFSWRRALIGLLVMANALPYTLDPSNRKFAYGIVAVIIGLVILAAPLPSRRFTFFDAVRVICSAVCFGLFVILYEKTPTAGSIALAIGGTLPLFIPWSVSGSADTKEKSGTEIRREAMEKKGWYER